MWQVTLDPSWSLLPNHIQELLSSISRPILIATFDFVCTGLQDKSVRCFGNWVLLSYITWAAEHQLFIVSLLVYFGVHKQKAIVSEGHSF